MRTVESLLADGLFGSNITEALTSRLANLVVLPAAGEAAYWFEEGRFEQRFFGQHGGPVGQRDGDPARELGRGRVAEELSRVLR